MKRSRLVVLLVSLSVCAFAIPCRAIELATYTVESRDAPFEIRNYGPSIVAIVQVDGTRGNAVNAGFRVLANYIFGGNDAKAKFAMTAPVAETVVPGHVASGNRWSVRFTMPAASTLDRMPAPRDPRVHLVALPLQRRAVIQFSGLWNDLNFETHQVQLSEFVKKRGLTPLASPVYAYYDPPWTPWFRRTNEVQMEIAPRP